MANAIPSPRPTRQLSPDDFNAIRRLMRETDQANADIDAERSALLGKALADRPDRDDVLWELEAYNRRLQYTLLINAYLLGRELIIHPETASQRSSFHALVPLSCNCSVMADNVFNRL